MAKTISQKKQKLVPLSDEAIEKLLDEVTECAKQEDAPVYEGDKEIDMWVRLSDVKEAIDKYFR